jgi:PAS domain S-box-containing protein
LVVVSYVVFGVGTLAFWLFPFVVWAAVRFGQVGSVTAVFVICVMAIWGTAQGGGPFVKGSLRENLLLLHGFMGIMAVTAMTLAASLAERKHARKSADTEALQRGAVLNAALDCVIFMDHEGCIREFNPAAENVFGYARAEVIGREMASLIIPERFRAAHRQGLVRYLATGEGPAMDKRIELFALRKDGSEFPVELAITRISVDGPPMFTGFIRDITEIKRVKEQQLAAEESLRHAVRARDEFLSIASHELKTPLTSLKLQLQMTKSKINLEERKIPPPEKLYRVFDVSNRQVDRLVVLVEDLLDASRIQTGKFSFNFEQVNLSEVVKEMVARFTDELQRAGCRVDLDVQEKVVGIFDQARIEQVIDNLLSNIVKYAPGAPVMVSLRAREGGVSLVVQDHGTGISEEKREKIFERFERATDAKGVSGLGLGLFIVKEIAKGHGGDVRLQSGQAGSAFTVDLPLGSPAIHS